MTATLAIRPFNFGWVIFAGLMAGLPDFDLVLLPLNKIRESFYFQHRGGSHSLVTAAIVAMPFAGIFTAITSENFFVAWGIGVLFYSLHLGLDALTTYRTPLFYPITKTVYKFGFERAVNPVLMFVSLALDLFLVFYQWSENTFQQVVTGIAIGYFGYLAYRIGVKALVERNAPPGTRVIPGTLPFVYYVYQQATTDSTVEYRFSKRVSICRKTIELYRSTFRTDSPEYVWSQKGLAQLSNGRFFGSWDSVIPTIEDRGDRVVVKLLYAEAYMIALAFVITIEFERATQQVINMQERFERITTPRQRTP